MNSLFNKPRVFLSHSKIDAPFVEKVCFDLRKCQIEPWLDIDEIRHGKPWLDSIFEDGIPTCDAVLVYFTNNSIESNMVKKEMDVGILQQLKDRKIAFLPYVGDAAIRSKLRADIQALQVLEWNDDNYQLLLPRVVAEIWHSYLERMVTLATHEEKIRRLQAELELEKLQKGQAGSVFSPSEETEFSYIWESFDKFISVNMIEKKSKNAEKNVYGLSDLVPIRSYKINFRLNTLISLSIRAESKSYSYEKIVNFLIEQAKNLLVNKGICQLLNSPFSIEKLPDFTDQLMMYGLLERIYQPPPEPLIGRMVFRGPHNITIYGPKSYRFKYWLAYHNMLPGSIEFEKDIEIIDLKPSH